MDWSANPRGAPHQHALIAASLVDLATSFTGDNGEGIRWLIDHIGTTPVPAPAREVHNQAIRLADPHNGWAALSVIPGGEHIAAVWARRRTALAAYRDRPIASKNNRLFRYSRPGLSASSTPASEPAITAIPTRVWTEAIDADSARRDGTGLVELSHVLPARVLADHSSGTRVIVRRERPHSRRSTTRLVEINLITAGERYELYYEFPAE